MTDIAELHGQALEATGRIVRGIAADRWHDSTPCPGWDARTLVSHLVSGNLWAAELAAGGTIESVGSRLGGDLLGPDPAGCYDASANVAAEAFHRPGALDAPCAVSYGPVPGSVYAGHRFFDVFIHGWDLAAATGQDTRLDAGLMQACREVIEPQLESFRGAGALAGPLPVPPGASAQARFLAMLGRGRMTPVNGAGPVRELLARASSRQSVPPGDGKSGAACERVTVDGTAYFVKRLSPASDWVMRVTGDHAHRPYLAWQAGIMDRAPGCIDHTLVAMDLEDTGGDAVLTMLMRDVGGFLVPPGDTVVPSGQHAGFVAHMAGLAAAFWGWDDDIGLTTMTQRLRLFAPDNIAGELAAAEVPGPIAAAAAGWKALPGRSPLLAAIARLVHGQPEVIAEPLAAAPHTFVHGDWKMGNLGTHPDGRTILLDWALPGSGPACWDLCWYLALNRARLPEPKEAVIGRFRAELEACGIVTDGWWQQQLDLCMIGVMATFGWEKALGDAGELGWWEDAVARAAARCGVAVGPAGG